MPSSRMLPLLQQLVLLFLLTTTAESIGILQSLIRNNVAGPDVNFKEAPWPFDPNAGIQRSIAYQKENGRFGWKAVERVGLGEDGLADERRQQQQYRDSIGALTYKVPGWDS